MLIRICYPNGRRIELTCDSAIDAGDTAYMLSRGDDDLRIELWESGDEGTLVEIWEGVNFKREETRFTNRRES